MPTRTQTTVRLLLARERYRLIRDADKGWLRFASTTAPGDIFIAHTLAGQWLLSIEHVGVAREFGPSTLQGPGVCTMVLPTLSELHQAVARNFNRQSRRPEFHAYVLSAA